jgi:predicted nucleotidyltransferase
VIARAADIDLIVERILACCTPTLIYLFGSQARGYAHVHSDVDLLIVEPTTLPRQYRGTAVTAALRGFAASFDVLHYTPGELAEELDDPMSFAFEAVASSRVLYAAGSSPPHESQAQELAAGPRLADQVQGGES